MAGTISKLPAVAIEGHQPTAVGTEDHPMRHMTRRAAGLVPDAPWDDEARAEVAAYFDDLAPLWHTRTSPGRDAVVADVLERGVPADLAAADVCVELGSGIGAYTPMLATRWRRVVAVELALEMLQRAPAEPGHRVLADGAALPVVDGSVDAVVLVNCFLFPQEVDRVLRPEGLLVWVNSSGTNTPIHLSSTEVVTALPGQWEGVASEAGEATWCVARRTAR